jgi:hypothetical protein
MFKDYRIWPEKPKDEATCKNYIEKTLLKETFQE